MDTKDIAVALGFVALVACLYWHFYYVPGSGDFFFGRGETTYSSANAQLQSSDSVCLVENISNLVDPARMNVMNCGIDFASSLGGIKDVEAYVIEGESCTSMAGVRTIGECAREIHANGCYIIFVGNVTGPRTLDGLIYVPIGGTYVNNSCSVKVSS
jgi:hypothetical protein